MTILGPPQLIACPLVWCKGLATYMTLVSGNTFGAKVWTDGYRLAPMLPSPPPVFKCRHCAGVSWLKDAEDMGVAEESYEPPKDTSVRMVQVFGKGTEKVRVVNVGSYGPPKDSSGNEIQPVMQPSETDYYAAIAKGLARNPQEELTARKLAWWQRNHQFCRHRRLGGGDHQDAENDEDDTLWRGNLEMLLVCYDKVAAESGAEDGVAGLAGENIKIMKAEILRELGRFDDALEMLGTVSTSDENMSWAVDILQGLCHERDPMVRQLYFQQKSKGGGRFV